MGFLQLLFFFLTWAYSPVFGAAVTSQGYVYFSPDDAVEKRLIELIEKEQKSIYVCVYTFTHRGVAQALIEAKKRGVEVEVIVDRFSIRPKSPLHKMVQQGVSVYVWDPDSLKRKKAHRPLMHNKFCVFGSETVWTGSSNITYETKMHQENVIVLKDSSLASAFKSQFYTIKVRSCIPLTSFIASNPRKKSKSQL